MRFEAYKLIVETATSICDAAVYVKYSGDNSMLEICKDALLAIKSSIDDNKEAVKSDRINGIISELSTELREVTYNNIDTVINLAEELRQECVTGLDYKIRALILAELGGKWDSIASVYDELMQRDDCEVEVVIEPVYREVKLPDGSTRKDVVLEDYLTPKGISNIPYQEYDIAVSKPDITFYSQPYDGCTVPMFRTENLAKHSRLVYCPYYASTMLAEHISITKDAFFRMPMQQHSWKIACQSERMKQYYQQYASRKGANVVASGLPKWDYPLKLNRENTPCPEEWSEKLSGKKVFLWNSHFGNINQSANDQSESFGYEKSVLSIFMSNPDIALIWRPHPMAETVLKVYSPDKHFLYRKLIDDCMAFPNIVVDETATYDNAVVWSDVLLSDLGSSLADQYIIMDKPVALICTNSEKPYEKYYTVDKLFDYSKTVILSTVDMIKQFVEDISSGSDSTAEGRKYIRENSFSLADGEAGKRFVEALLNDFYNEEFPLPPSDDEKRALVIGSPSDIAPCVKSLAEKGVDYRVCGDYIADVDFGDEQNVISIDDISAELYDFAVVADKAYSELIYRLLASTKGFPEERILNFGKMYNASLPPMVCDRVMMNPKQESYEGIILGISHTEVGIQADRLKAPFCNLAVSSQDIYYQLKTLEHCLENYPEKLKNLKYAIVDFYDYYYFNYDTSLSMSAVNYISYGGYLNDPHHFAVNKNFKGSHEAYVKHFDDLKLAGISEDNILVWNEFFSDVHKYTDFEGFCGNFDLNNRFREVTEADINNYKYTGGSMSKIFPETVKENVAAMKKLLSLLKSVNKDIKIYAVIVPKYIETEVRQSQHIAKFIDMFEGIVAELQQEFEFTMLDFKKMSDISNNRQYFYDAAHLNYFGARYFTDELNRIIFGEISD